MDKNNQLVLGIIVILIIAGGLGYWMYTTTPSKDAVSAVLVPVKTIRADILSGNTADAITSKKIYGQVPVVVNQGELGRSNPFSDY